MSITALDPTQTYKNAFPTLTAADMDILQPYALCEYFEDGELIFEAGQADIDMFVVRAGGIEIFNPANDNKHIITHQVGQFSGDIDVLTTRPVVVSGRAFGKTHVMRVNNTKLREVLHKVPKLSEKLLTAFLERREMLTEAGKLGLRVLGHSKCGHTTEIREFLYKNFVPFTFYDIQTDDGQVLAKTLGLPEGVPTTVECRADLPVVECRDGAVLSKPNLREIAEGAGIWRHCPNGEVDVAIIGAGPRRDCSGCVCGERRIKNVCHRQAWTGRTSWRIVAHRKLYRFSNWIIRNGVIYARCFANAQVWSATSGTSFGDRNQTVDGVQGA